MYWMGIYLDMGALSIHKFKEDIMSHVIYHMLQDCNNCRWIWSGNVRCIQCTEKEIQQWEKEYFDKLFADWIPRGGEPP